jgi:hypothetical protein
MGARPTSKRGAARTSGAWGALTSTEKLAAVREVCGTRGPQLKKKFDGVLAVGAGFKKSKNQVSEDICIGFLVEKKRERQLKRPVPQHVTVFLVRDGAKVRYKIPTDVEELGSGSPHAEVNLALGIRAAAPQNAARGVPGAACCVVEQVDQPSNRYVLGCHHVLALSLLTQQCNAEPSTVRARGSAELVGSLFEYIPMSGTGQPCLDAAIALVDPGAGVSWNSSGVVPTQVEPGVQSPRGCRVYTPDGDLPAQFVKEWANVPLPYPSCGQVVIECAYQFLADTKGGHSGSPVMEPDGTLHGMHFWGDVSQRLAFAIPAFVLFRPGLFSVSFRLV